MKEGTIIDYDGFVGEIESDNTNYIFLNDDTKGTLSIGDIVTFNAETKFNINRAFFVKKKVEDTATNEGII